MVVNLRTRSESYAGFKTKWGFSKYFFSAQGTDLDHSKKADKVDGSGFGTEYKNEPPGMKEASLKFSGLAAMKRGHVTYVLDQRAGRVTPTNVWYCTEGMAVGSPVVMQPSYLTDHSIKAKLKDSVTFDAEWSAAGASDLGTLLLSPQVPLAGASGDGLIEDNLLFGGATNFGAAAQLHVLAIDGGTTPGVTVTIEHSPDGTTFTPLCVFDTFTKPGDQRIEIPFPTLINAQLQASWVVTGTPTAVQVLLGFSRSNDPDA